MFPPHRSSGEGNSHLATLGLRRRHQLLAWGVHALTASGVLVGMAALLAVLAGEARTAILWLVLAQVIDGIDGPLARKLHVDVVVPELDGNVLDLVVDYVTCVVVPAAFLYSFKMLPGSLSMIGVAMVLLTSALWFSRRELMTSDKWFRGWPAVWNLAVPVLYLAGTTQWQNLALVAIFASLTLTNLPFVHPLQVTDRRPLTAAITIFWLGLIAYLVASLPNEPSWSTAALLGPPIYYCLLTVDRVRRERRGLAWKRSHAVTTR